MSLCGRVCCAVFEFATNLKAAKALVVVSPANFSRAGGSSDRMMSPQSDPQNVIPLLDSKRMAR